MAAGLARLSPDESDAEIAAAELRLRIANQLNPAKIADYLSGYCPSAGSTKRAEDIIDSVESLVRLIYAANYAEAREETFPFSVEWGEEIVTAGNFRFRSHRFTRRRA
jgi:hypothetical protein